MKKAILLCFALTFSAAVSATAVTLSVPGDYTTIQDAIDEANDGDVIIVDPCTYYENINFSGRAITVTSTNPDDPYVVENTVIDAGGSGSVVTFANGEDSQAVLTGFTITGGFGTYDNSWGVDYYFGGGIYCYNASPTIRLNVITGNNGPMEQGGAMGIGGSISCLQSEAIVERNIIKENQAFYGGGVSVLGGNAIVRSNFIYDNSAAVGGGVLMENQGTAINNTIVSNEATFDAGNIYVSGQCLIKNNIISNGSAQNGGGLYWYALEQYDLVAYNNVYGNAGGDYAALANQTGSNGNISEDPLFVNPAGNDFHLQVDSPCVNAGEPDFVAGPDETDIDGEPRVYNLQVDIGADEYVGYLKPIADAGPDQYFNEIQLVTLDGSGSWFYDPAGIKEFAWTQTAGPAVQLSDPATEQPAFMPELEGEYLFELVVSDGANYSLPNEVSIVVGNRTPVADAGSNIVCQLPEQVTLDGTGSYDPDPWDELTYSWTQVQGPEVVLHDADTATPWFDCVEPGLYEFELVVSDSFEDSQPSTVRVLTIEVTSNRQNLNLSGIGTYAHYGDVSGSKVIYGVGGACDYSCDIKYKVLGSNQMGSFGFPFPGLDTQPKIDGAIVTWVGGPIFVGYPGGIWGHEPSNVGVLVRNITTGVQKTLGQYSWSESYSHPAVSGNKIVWLEHLNLDPNPKGSLQANNWYNTPYNIRGADITNLGSPTYFTIAEDVGNRDPYAFGNNIHFYQDFDSVIDISGNIAVWEAEGDIYGADISDLDDIRVFTICDDPARQFDPAVSGNIVVWTDERNDGGDIYGADISDLEDIQVFEIVKESGTQLQSAIDGCMLVYIDGGLYGGEIKVCCLTKKQHGVIHISLPEAQYGVGPAIDGDIIVWQTDSYGKAEGMALEVAYSIADGPIENLTTGKRYDYIQHAINDAAPADEIEVRQGTYNENICFKGKNIILRSTDPDNSNILAATIIDGSGSGAVVTFEGAEDANCVLAGFTITGGYGWLNGGGISGNGTHATITHCVITKNTADSGGGIHSHIGTLSHCIISGNSSGTCGGGIYLRAGSPVITNCTITGNLTDSDGGGVFIYDGDLTLTNCILWGNSDKSGMDESAQIERRYSWPPPAININVNYSCIQGWTGALGGIGNTGADPCFVDPNNGDYHLLADSPCIDAGDNTAVSADTTDLDGNRRLIDNPDVPDTGNGTPPIVDMGAYEFVLRIEVPMKFTPQALNPGSKGKWLKAHFVLPERFTIDDVDANSPAKLWPLGIESQYLNVFINEGELVEIEAAFERSAFCSNRPFDGTVTVEGLLTSGNYFYGTDTIKIIDKTFEYLASLAYHWLQADCGKPDWCDGFDLDHSSTVDFVDFAMFDGCCIEVITP